MNLVRSLSAFTFASLLSITAAAQDKQPPPQPNGGSAPSDGAPVMVIESFTHDFGEVNSGTPLRYAFKVKNQGKADLLINSVSPG